MKSLKSVLRSEGIFSEDDVHRLSLKKTWNTKQPMVTVITKYPRFEGGVKIDLTTQLIVNNASEMGYGGVYLMNLFTNVNINDAVDDIEVLTHEDADNYLLKAIEDCENVILAWGSSSSKITSHRIDEINHLLKDFPDKVKKLINPTTKNISHPLNPKSRSFWMVEKLEYTKEIQ